MFSILGNAIVTPTCDYYFVHFLTILMVIAVYRSSEYSYIACDNIASD